MHRNTTYCLAGLVIVACASPEPPDVERFETDGVQVVVSHAPAWEPEEGWRIRSEPSLRLGEDESAAAEYLFSGVAGASRLPDGRVVVADRTTAEIRLYDATGVFLRAVGGVGEGPGEFNWIFALRRCGPDRLHVVDNDASVSILDTSGSFLRRIDLSRTTGLRVDYSYTCDSAGRFLVREQEPIVRREGSYRISADFHVLDAEGNVLAELGTFPDLELVADATGGGPHPLGKQTAFALGGGRAWIGTADAWEVEVFSLTGELMMRIRREVDLGLDPEEAARTLDELLARSPPEQRDRSARRWEDAPLPASWPAYERLLLDDAGNLWVEAFRRSPGAPRTWSVIGADGAWLGDVELPPTFELLEAGADHVLGRFRDELQQESVRVYELDRGAR